ncbi:hypothetical protein Tco_0308961 [Tanacetum coccineum]
MFMVNLTSEDLIFDEARASYDSDIPSEYMEDNAEHGVQSNVSYVQNDALMSIIDEMHDQGVQETSLKSELHSVQMQLRSTLDHHKSKMEEVSILKKDFKQKEDKHLEEFLDMKKLKDRVEDRLYKQDQSVQTSALYNGNEIVRTIHTPANVHDSEETLEIAEITRKRMFDKMKSPLCVQNKVKFAPPDYSKENYLAIFAPQRDLTPEQIFWSKDENDRKKAETSVPKPLSTPIVYPPNTPVKLVLGVLPTKFLNRKEIVGDFWYIKNVFKRKHFLW